MRVPKLNSSKPTGFTAAMWEKIEPHWDHAGEIAVFVYTPMLSLGGHPRDIALECQLCGTLVFNSEDWDEI